MVYSSTEFEMGRTKQNIDDVLGSNKSEHEKRKIIYALIKDIPHEAFLNMLISFLEENYDQETREKRIGVEARTVAEN